MNDFLLWILDENIDTIFGAPSCIGEIRIGEFMETFRMPLEYWFEKDYEQQWLEGLERLRDHDQTCLITAVQDPAKAPLVGLWALYKEGESVFIQNHLLFGKLLRRRLKGNQFTRESCYTLIKPRETVTCCDGEIIEISEWVTSVEDVEKLAKDVRASIEMTGESLRGHREHTYPITFELPDVGKIAFEFDGDALENLDDQYKASVFFIRGRRRYVVGVGAISTCLERLCDLLTRALTGQLKLHRSIAQDIGFMLNECQQGRMLCAREKIDGDKRTSWVFRRYLLGGWDEAAWIYNDDAGEIIFELTPCFSGDPTFSLEPGEQLDQDQIDELPWYEEWIKGYKPILVQSIPRSIALRWLEQASEILEKIKEIG